MNNIEDFAQFVVENYESLEKAFELLDQQHQGQIGLENFQSEFQQFDEQQLLEIYEQLPKNEENMVFKDQFIQFLDRQIQNNEQGKKENQVENSNSQGQNSEIQQNQEDDVVEQNSVQQQQSQQQQQQSQQSPQNYSKISAGNSRHLSPQQNNNDLLVQLEISQNQDDIKQNNGEELNKKKEQILNIFELPVSPVKQKINEFKPFKSPNQKKLDQNSVYQISKDLKKCDTLSALVNKYNNLRVDHHNQNRTNSSLDQWSNIITSQVTISQQNNNNLLSPARITTEQSPLQFKIKNSRRPSESQQSLKKYGEYATPNSKMSLSQQQQDYNSSQQQQQCSTYFDISHKNIFQSNQKPQDINILQLQTSRKKNDQNKGISAEKEESIKKFFRSKSPQEQKHLISLIKPKPTDKIDPFSFPIQCSSNDQQKSGKFSIQTQQQKEKVSQFKQYLDNIWVSQQQTQQLQQQQSQQQQQDNKLQLQNVLKRTTSPTTSLFRNNKESQALKYQRVSRGISQNKSSLSGLDVNNIYKEKLHSRQNPINSGKNSYNITNSNNNDFSNIFLKNTTNSKKADILFSNNNTSQGFGSDRFNLGQNIPKRTYNLKNFGQKISPKNNNNSNNSQTVAGGLSINFGNKQQKDFSKKFTSNNNTFKF